MEPNQPLKSVKILNEDENYPLIQWGPRQRPDLPVVSLIREGSTSSSPWHSHTEGQLIYAERGYLLLETDGKIVRLAADRAAWIPGGMRHAVSVEQHFIFHYLFFRPDYSPLNGFSIIRISPLVRELIIDAAKWYMKPDCTTDEIRKIEVLCSELKKMDRMHGYIGIPDEPRIAKICRAIEQNPADQRLLSDWADCLNIGEKTLHRLFLTHTGTTFQRWRTGVRMAKALDMCIRKERMLDVALAIGYSTESAFCQAFKRYFGKSPGELKHSPQN